MRRMTAESDVEDGWQGMMRWMMVKRDAEDDAKRDVADGGRA